MLLCEQTVNAQLTHGIFPCQGITFAPAMPGEHGSSVVQLFTTKEADEIKFVCIFVSFASFSFFLAISNYLMVMNIEINILSKIASM